MLISYIISYADSLPGYGRFNNNCFVKPFFDRLFLIPSFEVFFFACFFENIVNPFENFRGERSWFVILNDIFCLFGCPFECILAAIIFPHPVWSSIEKFSLRLFLAIILYGMFFSKETPSRPNLFDKIQSNGIIIDLNSIQNTADLSDCLCIQKDLCRAKCHCIINDACAI